VGLRVFIKIGQNGLTTGLNEFLGGSDRKSRIGLNSSTDSADISSNLGDIYFNLMVDEIVKTFARYVK